MLTNDCWISWRTWAIAFGFSFGAKDNLGFRHWLIAVQFGPLNLVTDYEVRPKEM